MTQQELNDKILEAVRASIELKGNQMLTCAGHLIDPLDPTPITLREIVGVLSRFRRYGAHPPRSWTIAQHAILCSYLVPQDEEFEGHRVALLALHHDDHEAYFGDWPKPLKNLIPGVQEVERGVEIKVRKALGLPIDLPKSVKDADIQALLMEMPYLWGGQLPEDPVLANLIDDLSGCGDDEVEDWYMERHAQLSRPRTLTDILTDHMGGE